VLVDDQPLFRQGLKLVLGFEPDLEVVGAAGTAAEAGRFAASAPSLMIIDVTLDDTDGVALAREIMALSPTTRVLILTIHSEEGLVSEVLGAGIAGIAFKSQHVGRDWSRSLVAFQRVQVAGGGDVSCG
jgi:DNA-binding NarL/FixJ family response regulator